MSCELTGQACWTDITSPAVTVMAIESFSYSWTDDGSVHHRVGSVFFTFSAEERPAVKSTLSFVRNSGNKPQSYRRQVTVVQSGVSRSHRTE
jgi:hypothetical protein